MGLFSESIDVACGPDGQPLTLQWQGKSCAVCAESLRWYERRQWWAEEGRAPLGSGQGLVDHEIWRVQVLPAGRNGNEDPPAEPLTLDLTRHISSGRWRLLRIHDALQPRTA